MNDQQIKNEILNILKVFDRFCFANSIKYVLAYGTLIGAIRHKGFIPWDDDVDVVITAAEYKKLREAASRSGHYLDSGKRYRIMFPGDDNYCYSFAKVIDTKYVVREKNISDRYNIGLFIDIFRSDHWPENRIKELYQLKKGVFLRRMNDICVRGNLTDTKYKIMDVLLKPVDLLFRIFGITSQKICIAMDHIASGNKPGKYEGVLSEGTGWVEEKIESGFYDETVLAPFEGSMFPIPAGYDKYLTIHYGDYMALPPEEKRTGHEYDIVSIREDM